MLAHHHAAILSWCGVAVTVQHVFSSFFMSLFGTTEFSCVSLFCDDISGVPSFPFYSSFFTAISSGTTFYFHDGEMGKTHRVTQAIGPSSRVVRNRAPHLRQPVGVWVCVALW